MNNSTIQTLIQSETRNTFKINKTVGSIKKANRFTVTCRTDDCAKKKIQTAQTWKWYDYKNRYLKTAHSHY